MYYQDKAGLATQVIENTVEGIMITNKKGKIISVNPAFTKITGYEPSEVIGKTPGILKSGKQDTAFYAHMWHMIEEKGYWQGEIWNRRKNEELYQERLSISAVRNDAGDVVQYAGMFSEIPAGGD
jgi:NNP family nitrate/nitrite transporter-like MFS transporter